MLFNLFVWFLWGTISLYFGRSYGLSDFQSLFYGFVLFMAIGIGWFYVGMTLYDRPSYLK